MTKRQAMQKVRELAQRARRTLIEDAEYLIDSGAINMSDYENDYVLPKILLSAALERKKDIYRPLFLDYKKEVKNLTYF